MFKLGDRVLIYDTLFSKSLKAIILKIEYNDFIKKTRRYKVALLEDTYSDGSRKFDGSRKIYWVLDKNMKLDVVAQIKKDKWRNAGRSKKYD